jgi:aerobic carbon-monoxide dehydrogenase medium subunit
MYPRPFEYSRADSTAEAITLLTEAAGETRLLAGGQSLVPMMSLGLARPDRVVDVGGLELAGLERADGKVRLGALTRHRQLERSAEFAEALPLAAEAAHHIGNPRVRNRGTLGGSLAHADPAAELGAVVLTYGGTAIVEGSAGERTIPLSDFFHGLFETAIGSREMLTRIELDRPPPGTVHGFREVAGRADDFATAAAATLMTLAEDGRRCARVRLALAGVADRPVRLEEVEELCVGEPIGEALLDEVMRRVREAVHPEGDAFMSAGHRQTCAAVCARRALQSAWSRAGADGA